MDPLQLHQLDKIIEMPEMNLEDNAKTIKKKSDSQLIDGKDSFGNAFVNVKENTSSGTRELNESFTSGSCTLLEDIDTPSSFNSSTICVEKILSLSDESSQDSKDKIVESNEGSVNDFSPRTLLGNDTSYLLKESEKVLEALKGNKTISCKKQGSPISKLNILDLDNLNDSLLADFTQFMCKENDLQDQDGPSMSTPKNFDKSNISNLTGVCKSNLNFNGTFEEGPLQEENVFSKNEKIEVPNGLKFNGTFDKSPVQKENPLRKEENWDETLETEKSKKGNQKVFNTTYDKETSKAVREPVMNVTFETGSPKKTEEPLNKTFEVVGNGSFIIDGQCTTLMDMESNALNTVLGSASNTPVSRGIKSYPDVKKLDKSTLKKRLSLINYQLKEDLTSTITERSSQTSTAGSREENDEKSLPSSKVDSQNILKNQFTKEQILSRLRKNTHPQSSGVSGPLKAVPIAAIYNSKGQVNQIQEVEKRATSTPTGIQKVNENQDSNSGEKQERLPSLPSFGSVSSIGTDGINSKDICTDDFMATPEVFRHRNKSLAAHVTSTPTVMTSDIKFDTDLGLGSAVPTPILAPKASSLIKSFKTEKNINNSYVCEAKKGRQDIVAKSRLSFATSSEGGSPDSLREDNKSEDKVVNVIKKEGMSVSLDTSKNKTTIKGKNYDQISKLEASDTAVENLEADICQIPVKESGLSNASHSAANKDLKAIECGTILFSTAKEGIEVQKNGFSNYINEAERKFERLDNVPDKVCSENDHISTVKDCSLEFTDGAIALPNSDRINSVKDPDIILQNANEMIEAYEKLCEDEIHNFTNEIKCEAPTIEKSEKNEKCQSDAGKAGNTINKTLKPKEIVKSTSRASLSKFPNSGNKALNPSSKVLSKPLASSKRLSHQPSTKVEGKPTQSGAKSANSRLSTPRFSGSQPLRPSVKHLSTTEKNSSVKKEVSVLKQETQTKMKLQLPRPALKSLNTRTLPNPKIEKKLPNSVSNRPKLTPNLRPTPTPNSRTAPTPKIENIQQKTLPNQSKIPSKNKSSLLTSRFSSSSSNKENDSIKSHVPKKTFIGSSIRPPSTKTCIPLPRAVSNR